MKAIKPFLLLSLSIASLQSGAQTAKNDAASLRGTWEEKGDTLNEIKIISPTHVFFFIRNVITDSFVNAGAGTYTLSPNQYTENLQYGSFDVKGIKASFNYNVQGNKMKQEGTLILGDGTQYQINHTFTRVEGVPQNSGKQIGTWNQLSSKFNAGNGEQSHTNATHIRYQIITPTHWMRISLANGAFENAFGGTYTVTGDKMIFNVDFASIPIEGATADLTMRFEGNKMIMRGTVKGKAGNKINEIEDVFERVDSKQ